MTIEQLRAAAPTGTGRDPSASKVLTVLQAFTAHHGSVSLGDLASHTALPKTTVHRMVGYLRGAGLVDLVEGRFRLTARVTELSSAVPAAVSHSVRESLLPSLTDLYEATREAVHLSVRSGRSVRVVERVHGRRSAAVADLFRHPQPAHCTAAGKALLAAIPELADVCLADAVAGRLAKPSPLTITTADRLRAELARIRREGVAVDSGEWRPGITGIAAPVWGAGRVLVGVLSVVGPAERLNPLAIAWRVRRTAELASRAEFHQR
ncbi:DNA-binding IclR family transcriptional regulator [Crossiella equi]|uniref:DNA-binding IclR family transcriptional regulator n=1 Tax=Crossiella equi TaxID=130796 RepID=A0ABS5A6G6_9PSEU|nr:IclR family transcriptional regulator [Crossiella equi]MBP2472190.1 DNA-binding IclR family transcriptional regulator [Crossiella equi]